LRDDGVSYGDYLEQLTYLLFLKMVDELEKEWAKPALSRPSIAVPVQNNSAKLPKTWGKRFKHP
jgi:type I restriction enzyme M protein